MSKEFDLFGDFKRAMGDDYDLSSKTIELRDGTRKTVAETLESFGGRESLLLQSHICELDTELKNGLLMNPVVVKKVEKGDLILKTYEYKMHDGLTRELALIGRTGRIREDSVRIYFDEYDYPKSVKLGGSFDWITSPVEMLKALKYFLY